MLGSQLAIGMAMILANVIFHVAGLVFVAQKLSGLSQGLEGRHRFVQTVGLLIVSVLAVILIHAVEVWSWAALYLHLGELGELHRALYFSAVTSTTLGYGDVTLSERWQLLSTFEAVGGLILFGVSTAFLLAVMRSAFEPARKEGPGEG